MNSKFLEINCWCGIFAFHSLHCHLSNFDEYKCTVKDDGLTVDLKVDGESIRINLTKRWMENIHVCLADWWMKRSKKFSEIAKDNAEFYKKNFQTVPIIIICFGLERKYHPGEIKYDELDGGKMMNRKIGDKLARKLGAIKYIEYSDETGRGAKILIDEIAFAGIGKTKDDKKRRKALVPLNKFSKFPFWEILFGC